MDERINIDIQEDILSFYESEEGQREFAEWKRQREADSVRNEKGDEKN